MRQIRFSKPGTENIVVCMVLRGGAEQVVRQGIWVALDELLRPVTFADQDTAGTNCVIEPEVGNPSC